MTHRKLLSILILVGLLLLLASPLTLNAQVSATAVTGGFGAAFSYAQTIGPAAFTASGSIGNGYARGTAFTGFSGSVTEVFSAGPAAAWAQSIGTPFGSTAFTQVASMFGGFANGFAFAAP